MKALIVDDDEASCDGMQNTLKAHGVEVDVVCKPRYSEAAAEVCKKLRAISGKPDAVDFLILDLHYKDHFLGGARIYTNVLRQGLRGRFRHIIIPSRYYDEVDTPQRIATELFMELAFIPPRNLLPKLAHRDEKLVNLIQILSVQEEIETGSFERWRFC